MHTNKALFLDRDGVIIKDVSYPHKVSDLHINEDLIPFLKKAMDLGYLLIIVTNQAGISKGKFTLEDYDVFHKELLSQLEKRGVKIAQTYFCPYHKDGIVKPYNIDSSDRKPEPGMIIKAQKDYGIDIGQSYMIGDKESDIIKYQDLKCYIISSNYTKKSNIKTYRSFKKIFEEIEL